ncbi:MAG: hypothetical protein WCX22_00495 [Methanoregula sp.]
MNARELAVTGSGIIIAAFLSWCLIAGFGASGIESGQGSPRGNSPIQSSGAANGTVAPTSQPAPLPAELVILAIGCTGILAAGQRRGEDK